MKKNNLIKIVGLLLFAIILGAAWHGQRTNYTPEKLQTIYLRMETSLETIKNYVIDMPEYHAQNVNSNAVYSDYTIRSDTYYELPAEIQEAIKKYSNTTRNFTSITIEYTFHNVVLDQPMISFYVGTKHMGKDEEFARIDISYYLVYAPSLSGSEKSIRSKNYERSSVKTYNRGNNDSFMMLQNQEDWYYYAFRN